MNRRSRFSCAALALALLCASSPASATVGDFRLPTGPGQQTQQPEAEGPVAPDVPESRAPGPAPTTTQAAPAPTPPIVVPQVAIPPRITVPVPTPTPAPTQPASAAPGARPSAAPDQPPAPVTAEIPAPVTSATEASPGFDLSPLPTAPATPRQLDVEPIGEGDGLPWPWIGLGIAALALIGAGAWFLSKRRTAASAAVPIVERPKMAPPAAPQPESPVPAAPPAPPPAVASTQPLLLELAPQKLSLTLINAALSYRLEISNRGARPITDLAVSADMIAAHASLSREEQLSGPPLSEAPRHQIDRLEPGESRVISGEFRLPFPQITPIRQGSAALLLPLARFRLEAEGAQPQTQVFAVGQAGAHADAGLQPFRLDQGPRVYPHLTHRAFA